MGGWLSWGCRDFSDVLNRGEEYHHTFGFPAGSSYDGAVWVWVEIFDGEHIVYRTLHKLDRKGDGPVQVTVGVSELLGAHGQPVPMPELTALDPATCFDQGEVRPCGGPEVLPPPFTDPSWCSAKYQGTDSCTWCGDGVPDPLEPCDPGAGRLPDNCSALGLGQGRLSCTEECVWDTTNCEQQVYCGNGKIDPGEDCDGLNLGQKNCRDLGMEDGLLLCSPDCRFDTDLCLLGAEGCGDGTCDEASDEDPWSCPEDCGFVQVSAGLVHTCARDMQGGVWCWGDNQHYALGNPDVNGQQVPRPVFVPNLPPVAQISAGLDFTCALGLDGHVYCWGDNQFGQLGIGTMDPAEEPERVQADAGIDWTEIKAGFTHTCALASNGDAYCWGDNSLFQLASDTLPTAVTPKKIPMQNNRNIAVGAGHTCMDHDGMLNCWGDNALGQLGRGSFTDPSSFIGTTDSHPWAAPFLDLDLGGNSSCVLDSKGVLYCWGDNGFGQLGIGNEDPVASPTMVEMPQNVHWIQFSMGAEHACAVNQAGQAWCWGHNDSGQVTDVNICENCDTPREVALPAGVAFTQIAAGISHHTCALDDKHQVWCWGTDTVGELGLGVIDGEQHPPTRVSAPGPH